MSTFALAKSSNLDLILRNDLDEIVFNCQGVNLPGLSLGEINIPFMGQNNPIPGDSLTFNPLTVNVICDEDLNTFYQAWRMITSTKTLEGTVDPEFPLFDAILVYTSNKNNVKRLITFRNAWLQDFSDLTFETTGDDSFLTFALTFRYTNYVIGELLENA